jgi:succinate dehydrogenase / fumarate reductase cytochrome b subunit
MYRPGLWTRMAEGLRYGGGVGQWSWLIHRLTGLGILVFLVLHILDTFFVVAYPGLYDHTLSLYSGRIVNGEGKADYYWPLRWAFRLSELALIACVVFHSVNGVRVAMVDLWPGAARHQKAIFKVVMIVFLAIMLVVAVFVFKPLAADPEFWNFPGEPPPPLTSAAR